MTPAKYVRVLLTEFRNRDTPFMEAWTRCIQTLPRGSELDGDARQEWLTILRWSRPAYQAAYERAAPPQLGDPPPLVLTVGRVTVSSTGPGAVWDDQGFEDLHAAVLAA